MNYHNPENLSDWGQSDGWRLLTTEEKILPDDAEFMSAGEWVDSRQRGEEVDRDITYRTKKPLPVSPLIAQLDAEIKAKQELKEIALAVEAGAEWEVRCGAGQDCWHKAYYELEWYLTDDRAPIWQVRLKPKPVTRDWNKPGDVPLVTCRLRWKKGPEPESWATILSTCGAGVTTACSSSDGEPVMTFTAWEDLKDHEYSTGGEWKPCETTEEAK